MNTIELQQEAVSELLSLLPETAKGFTGSEYPFPIKTTFLGDSQINTQKISSELKRFETDDVKYLLEPVLLGAEIVEAARADKEDFFIKDKDVRSYVFNSKWRAGWVLVLGNNAQEELVSRLKEKNFLVFTDVEGLADTIYIGNRDTSPIYFLQMMVRYGLIWGRIAPGDDHEMGHHLEKDMPGFLLVSEDLPALKYLVVLGMMKLGAPEAAA